MKIHVPNRQPDKDSSGYALSLSDTPTWQGTHSATRSIGRTVTCRRLATDGIGLSDSWDMVVTDMVASSKEHGDILPIEMPQLLKQTSTTVEIKRTQPIAHIAQTPEGLKENKNTVHFKPLMSQFHTITKCKHNFIVSQFRDSSAYLWLNRGGSVSFQFELESGSWLLYSAPNMNT